MLHRTFKAFQYPDFRLMWGGACTSSIGTWMQKLAQSWLVLEISGSPFLLGLDSFLGEIPIFLFSLVGGVVADRMDRRHLLLVSQFIQMGCALFLASLFAFGVVQVWHILCLSFIVGLAQAFGGPAYQALIPTLVKSEDLPNAIALNSIQFNVARVVGPVLGGLALTNLGAAWCFGLNGLSFIAVITTLILIKARYKPADDKRSMLDSMKMGIGFIRSKEAMTALILLAFLMTMLGIPLVVFLPVFAKDVFQKGPSTYTLFLAISGIGSIVGALLVATFHHRRRMGLATVVMIVALGLCITGFALSKSMFLSCALLFVGSAVLISVFALISSLVQLITTDEMRGRVMSVYNVAFRGGMPFGSLVTGSLVKDLGAPLVVSVNGALLACLGLYYLLVQKKVAKL
ncbi:MAG: MFS transporter [Acidimicrobiia bacterium]|nr:MFS transporter [Acidimicrobiia bacterium]